MTTRPAHYMNSNYTCPSCGSRGMLYLGRGGYITCGWVECPEPGAAHTAALAALQYTALPRSKYHTAMERR